MGPARSELAGGRGCGGGLLPGGRRALVQAGPDVVGGVGPALPLVAGQHRTTGGDTRETGKSEQLPEAHGP